MCIIFFFIINYQITNIFNNMKKNTSHLIFSTNILFLRNIILNQVKYTLPIQSLTYFIFCPLTFKILSFVYIYIYIKLYEHLSKIKNKNYKHHILKVSKKFHFKFVNFKLMVPKFEPMFKSAKRAIPYGKHCSLTS